MTENSKSNSSSHQSRRKQYFIKQPFQRNFIWQFCLLILLAGFLIGGAVYLYANQTITTAFINSRLQVMSTGKFLLPALGMIVLAVTAIATIVAAYRLLFFSHKIAGPLYRLEKTAKEIGKGDFSFNIKLRSNDELQELAKSMETMVEDLRPKIHAIKIETERLQEVISQIKSNSSKPEESAKVLEDIYAKLSGQVSYFRG